MGSFPFPSVITDETNRLMLEQARAENDAIARVLLDTISGWDKLHTEVGGDCRDIFSDQGCNIDAWSVTRVAHYG